MASHPNPDPESAQMTSETAYTKMGSFSPKGVVQKVKTNLVFHSKWGELNGAMGDLGTYIPIILALTLARDLNLGTTLIFTGAIYGVPMPVQPMKSIAAEALKDAKFLNINRRGLIGTGYNRVDAARVQIDSFICCQGNSAGTRLVIRVDCG
ncbi:hypothetical protein L6164_024054 [Bauhinia variegata]|uniref:Uncharacterized protein n=1 Tax=Bauhinia variegata TaxID=167791 RepID=A0ACB9LXV1_BAUVA|nr:hypothetical protein L6164_024054 [Bauhinia variegata]